MGLRFRKSIKLGKLLKLNINKGSVSLSAGVKGAHITVNNKGKKTASVGIPGSGLSYSKVLDSGNTKAKRKNKKDNESEDILDNIKEEVSDTIDEIKNNFSSNDSDNDNNNNNSEEVKKYNGLSKQM